MTQTPEDTAAKRFVVKRRSNLENMRVSLARRLAAEFIGTLFLLAIVVGSGIMAERLAMGNMAVALLANTFATGVGLFVLILTLLSVSRAHFNPAVTLVEALSKRVSASEAVLFCAVQVLGAVFGVVIANLMFDHPPVFLSTKARAGGSQWLSEFVATFGLLFFIAGASRIRSAFAVPLAVAAYISAAYWFTASTSFANPAVTIARSQSDTFAGIRPIDVPAFIVAQLAGAIAAMLASRWLFAQEESKDE